MEGEDPRTPQRLSRGSPLLKTRVSASKLLSLFKPRQGPHPSPLSPQLDNAQSDSLMANTNNEESIDEDDALSNIDVALITPTRRQPVRLTRSKTNQHDRLTRSKANQTDSPRFEAAKSKMKSKRQAAAETRIVDSDTLPIQLPASQKIIKTDTARNRVREDIATNTKFRRDAFLLHHQDYFLPLLPANNYISKLRKGTAKLPESVPYTPLETQPAKVKATMKPYQLAGLSFMANMYDNAMPAILGDEMGLGKTLQTLSLIQHLEETRPSSPELPRPYLVVCPLSVLGSWCDETRKWTPDLRLLRFHGAVAERNQLKTVASKSAFDIMVTTYEAFQAEHKWLKQAFVWRYCILDEGHKIKNDKTNISQALHGLKAEHRLLLTGTPLQNDLHEMWALLHWLYPEIFTENTADLFKNAFDISKGRVNPKFMDNARRLLELVMIRRMKSSPGVNLGLPPKHEILLYIPLTPFQRFWYTRLLTRAGDTMLNEIFGDSKQKERDALVDEAATENDFTRQNRASIQQAITNESAGDKETSAYKRLMNIVMQLRKACITPYMIKGAAPEDYSLGDHIMHASGKFIVLSKLVDELVVKQKKKILIFSGFTSAIDYCEDLLSHKGSNQHDAPFRHVRLDGRTPRAVRNLQIRLFNDPSSNYRVMLISTRAGGLGLNLTAASDVVFLDEDWNPQVTVQAEARSHRISQTKPVTIYKLVSSGTVEEGMLDRIRKKLYLSAKITESMRNIHHLSDQKKRKHAQLDGGSTEGDGPELGLSQLKSLIRRGATTLTHPEVDVNEMVGWDLDTVIDKCKDKHIDAQDGNAQSDERLDEQAWLAKMERVESAVLDGVKYQQKLDTQTAESLVRSDRRTGKNTTVMVDGFAINKQSMGCADWEAVPTLAGKDPRLAEPEREKAPPINHQDFCQTCYDGGEVYMCQSCPRVFHLECLSKQFQAKAQSNIAFTCPQHSCVDCGRNTHNAGGMIYRCRWCQRGYCEDCLRPESELLDATLPEYEALEFEAKNNAYYIHCHECKEAERVEPDVAKSIAEAKIRYDKEYQQMVGAQQVDDDVASKDVPSRDESMTDGITIESSGQTTPQVVDTKGKFKCMDPVDFTRVVDLTAEMGEYDGVMMESSGRAMAGNPKVHASVVDLTGDSDGAAGYAHANEETMYERMAKRRKRKTR